MVRKQVYRKLGGVSDHPGSFWGSGHVGYSEQCPVLIPQVGMGSSWLCAPTRHGASCREAARSCDCTVSLGRGKIERRRQLEATQLWVYVLLPPLVSVDCYAHPSLENLCERVRCVTSSYKLFRKFFKPPMEFRIYYNLYYSSLKSWRGVKKVSHYLNLLKIDQAKLSRLRWQRV